MRISYLFILTSLLIQCDNSIDVDYGPCKFAPPESKFPVLSADCNECYFILQFKDKEYSFAGNQLETKPSGIGGEPYNTNLIRLTRNAFLSFHFISPRTVDSLKNSRGIKTSLLKLDTLSSLKSNYPPPVSVSFGIYNYCKDFFEPIGNIDQSYHQLTDTELIESYPIKAGITEADLHDYMWSYFYCSGELHTTFLINGETQVVTARYKIQAEIWEKL